MVPLEGEGVLQVHMFAHNKSGIAYQENRGQWHYIGFLDDPDAG
jgi:hypothetical protein